MFWPKVVLHGIGSGVGLLVLVLMMIGMARLDWYLRPGEITHVPRHALDVKGRKVTSVFPGQKLVIGGKYETLRKGCTARFERVVEWTSNIYGPITQVFGHSGSFDVTEPKLAWAKHIFLVPADAEPETDIVNRIADAWFDCLHFPLQLSRIPRSYAPVVLRVR